MEGRDGKKTFSSVIRSLKPKIIDYYIIRKFLGTFFFCLLLIITIAVVFDFTEKIDNFMEKAAPWQAIVFDYYPNFYSLFRHPLCSVVCFYFGDLLYITDGSKHGNNSYT